MVNVVDLKDCIVERFQSLKFYWKRSKSQIHHWIKKTKDSYHEETVSGSSDKNIADIKSETSEKSTVLNKKFKNSITVDIVFV